MDENMMELRIKALEATQAALEARYAAIEARLAVLQAGGTVGATKRKKDYSPEQRQAIRARLLAGQKAKREREAAAATAAQQTTEKPTKKNGKKEASNGMPS